MLWLIVTISAYFLQAIAALVDKYLLKSHIPSAKVYTFYVGILSIVTIIFIPLGFYVPAFSLIVLNLLAGAFFLLGLFALYKALIEFEVSRVIPAIGGILPLFVFCWVYLSSGGKEVLGIYQILSLILLILGSVLIVYDKDKSITLKSFQISVLAAFLFSVCFILSKFAYETQPFWSAFIWIRIGAFLTGILFLLSKEVRDEIFRKKHTFKRDTGLIFMANQLVGGASSVLQNWAVALVPFGLLVFVNALEGTKYVFVLILAAAVSIKFPKILSEEISRKIILQKIAAVSLIAAGLIILVL
jgi:drug/metabolite transporter (DMT)-like permease